MKDWLNTRVGNAVQAVVALGLCYVFGSLAIDTGSYLQYLAALVLFIFSLNRLVRVVRGK